MEFGQEHMSYWPANTIHELVTNEALPAFAAKRPQGESWALVKCIRQTNKSAVFLLNEENSNRRAALKILAPGPSDDASSRQFNVLETVSRLGAQHGRARVPTPLADLPQIRGFVTEWIDAPGLQRVASGSHPSPLCRTHLEARLARPRNRGSALSKFGRWLADIGGRSSSPIIPSSSRGVALFAVGRWLADLHELFPRPIRPLDAEARLSGPILRACSQYDQSKRLASADRTFRAAYSVLERMIERLEGANLACVKLHGDAAFHNFLIDESGIIGLDISAHRRGPPAVDLVRIIMHAEFRRPVPTPVADMNAFGVSEEDFLPVLAGYYGERSGGRMLRILKKEGTVARDVLKAQMLAAILTRRVRLAPIHRPTAMGFDLAERDERLRAMSSKVAGLE